MLIQFTCSQFYHRDSAKVIQYFYIFCHSVSLYTHAHFLFVLSVNFLRLCSCLIFALAFREFYFYIDLCILKFLFLVAFIFWSLVSILPSHIAFRKNKNPTFSRNSLSKEENGGVLNIALQGRRKKQKAHRSRDKLNCKAPTDLCIESF